MAWSGSTLYVLADGAVAAGFTTVMTVDPVTASARSIATVPHSLGMAVTRDGSTVLVVEAQSSGPAIYRLSLSGAAPTLVAYASNPNILLSPDGSTLVYHRPGSSPSSDTIAAMNIASGVVTATTVGLQLRATSFSPDGTEIALVPDIDPSNPVPVVYAGRAFIWTMATGSVATVPTDTAVRSVMDVQWTRGAFWAFGSGPGGYYEFPTATGVLTPFGNPMGFEGSTVAVAWAPSRPLMLTGFVSANYAYGDAGRIFGYSLRAVQPGGMQDAEIGSVNNLYGHTISPFVPSLDGKWLAYCADGTSLYLLAIP